MTDLLSAPTLLVEQPKKFFSVESKYHVYDDQGTELANVAELNLPGWMKVLRFLIKDTSNLPRKLQISDPSGQPVLVVDKPFAFFKPKTAVQRPDGTVIGYIAQTIKIVGGTRFQLLDQNGQFVGLISGRWHGWEFTITDAQENEIAQVNKKFAGLTKELFTTADRYGVQMQPDLPEPLHTLVVASGVTLDVVLSESKE